MLLLPGRSRPLRAVSFFLALLLALTLLLTMRPPGFAEGDSAPDAGALPVDYASVAITPEPNPACYGMVGLDQAAEVMDVIQRARDIGLLEKDEPVAFSPDVDFYRGLYSRSIEYYLDDSILVLLWKEQIAGKSCTFAEVKIADASQLRRKFADDTYNAASEYYATVLAEQAHAVVAMNADYYRHRDFGILVFDGTLCRLDTSPYTAGYLKYNCVDTLFVTASGDFLYKRKGEENTRESIEAYIRDNDILFSVAFGPVLVENGEAVPCDWYPVGEVNLGYSRAGIGQMGERHYLYMSLNHGSAEARWNVTEFAAHFAEKPVLSAYCLDGGQTGEVVFRGEPYNYIDFGVERAVSDIIAFVSSAGA